MEKNIDLEFANIDLERRDRVGMQEVIYCQSKTAEQISGIVKAMLDKGLNTIFLTRLDEDKYSFLKQEIGSSHDIYYNEPARAAVVDWVHENEPVGNITIVAAGTSDLPVVEEAAVTCQVLGNKVNKVVDVGVAGLHRLLNRIEEIRQARVIIVVAGMEGALATVLGGLVDCPIIAVPTSVGYGASFNGLAALLAMLNSCAGAVSVVNIDNGFGAALSASKINHMGS